MVGNIVRKILYRSLSVENYLFALSKMYFISYDTGLLKSNRTYAFPYFLKNIVKKGDVCIDIGANLGYLSVIFSKLVGDEGKVYSVEPVLPVLAVLRRNTKGLRNIEILPYALGLENKKITLSNNTVGAKGYMASGSHSVTSNASSAGITFDADMRRGSELFGNLDKIDFIKCDIEGYEIVVLPEMEVVITKHRPYLLVESNGKDRKTLLDFFVKLGFKNFELEGGKLFPATESAGWDFLVVPNEKVDSLKQWM